MPSQRNPCHWGCGRWGSREGLCREHWRMYRELIDRPAPPATVELAPFYRIPDGWTRPDH